MKRNTINAKIQHDFVQDTFTQGLPIQDSEAKQFAFRFLLNFCSSCFSCCSEMRLCVFLCNVGPSLLTFRSFSSFSCLMSVLFTVLALSGDYVLYEYTTA